MHVAYCTSSATLPANPFLAPLCSLSFDPCMLARAATVAGEALQEQGTAQKSMPIPAPQHPFPDALAYVVWCAGGSRVC